MKASSLLWIKVYLIFPFIPFFVEAFFRITLNQCLNWNSFNASTFALIVSLICLFVTISLSSSENIAENSEEKAERLSTAETFKWFIVFSFSLFVGLIILEEIYLMEKSVSLKSSLAILKVTTFVICPIPIYFAVKAQQSFKLNSSKL